MRHIRRIMYVPALVLCFALFACGKKTDTKPTDTKPTSSDDNTKTDTTPAEGWSFQIKSNYDGAVVHTDKSLYNSGDTVTLTADSDSEYDCVGFVTCNSITFDYRDVEDVLSYTNTFTFVFGDENEFGPAVVNRIFAIYAPKGGKCVLTIYNEDVSVSTAGMFSKNIIGISVYGLSKKENRVLDYYYDFYETWTDGTITPCYDSCFDVPINQSKMIVFNTVPKDGETVKITLVNSNEEAGTVYQNAEFCQKNGYGIELKATPNSGYEFDGWYENDSLWSNETTWYDLMIFEWDITIVAKWKPVSVTTYTITTTNDNTSAGTCTIYTNQEFVCGTTVTLTATPNEGYVFDGWYFGENKEYKMDGSSTEEFSFLLVTDLYLTAKWSVQSSTTYYTLTTTNDNSSYGTCTIYTDQQFETGSSVTLTATPASGYEFDGWYNGTTKVSGSTNYTFNINSNLTLVAKWTAQSTTIYYTLTTTNSDASAGTCTIYTDQQFEVGSSVTITATPASGYVFDGWYSGTTMVSNSTEYTFILDSNVSLVAKWIEAPVGQYVLTTVNSYSQAGSVTDYNNQAFDKNSSVTLTTTVNTGYAFDGWYNGSTKESSNLSYTFTITSNITLTAKWKIKVSTTTGGQPSWGTYTQYDNALFDPNEEITVTVTPNLDSGYTYNGWYDNDTNELLSSQTDTTYTFNVTKPITLKVKWTYYRVTALPCYNSTNDIADTEAYYKLAGNVTTLNGQYVSEGKTVTLVAEPKDECVTWLGWYKKTGTNYTLLTEDLTYEFTMTRNDYYIVAKFLLYKIIDENVIQYGYYPQSVVEDNDDNADLLAELNSKYTSLPTAEEANGWTDYGYYDDGAVDSYMWYLDVDLDNDKIKDYRAVYFTKYRPNKCTYAATQGNSDAYDQGYRTETVYWFKYEPVVWDIVGDAGANDKRLVSRYAIDAQSFYTSPDNREATDGTTIYPNNYEESFIKNWLENTFYFTVLDVYRQSIISPNLTDNSAASTGSSTNQYALGDDIFVDKVYLLSYVEAKDYLDGSDYEKSSTTDYADVQGVSHGTSGNAEYANIWLRSPSNGNAINAKYVSSGGLGNNAQSVTSNYGIRPALNITL